MRDEIRLKCNINAVLIIIKADSAPQQAGCLSGLVDVTRLAQQVQLRCELLPAAAFNASATSSLAVSIPTTCIALHALRPIDEL
jgi:hypothetical protein